MSFAPVKDAIDYELLSLQDTPISFLLKTLHTPEINHSVQATFQRTLLHVQIWVWLTPEESQLSRDIPLKCKAHGFTKAPAR